MSLYVVTTGKVALTGNATKSLVLLNPVGPNATIRQIDISMDAASSAQAVEFDAYRVSSLGSPAGTTATLYPLYEGDPAAQTTALSTLTTEPTTVTVLAPYYVQPLSGLLVLPFPFGAEPKAKGGGARFGVRYVTPAGVTPDCICNVWVEE